MKAQNMEVPEHCLPPVEEEICPTYFVVWLKEQIPKPELKKNVEKQAISLS